MQSEHTPTPWIDGPFGDIWVNVQRDLSGKWSEIPGKDPTIVASVSNAEGQPAAANRALIVTAVNAYAPTKQRELAFEHGYRAGRARLILEKSNV